MVVTRSLTFFVGGVGNIGRPWFWNSEMVASLSFEVSANPCLPNSNWKHSLSILPKDSRWVKLWLTFIFAIKLELNPVLNCSFSQGRMTQRSRKAFHSSYCQMFSSIYSCTEYWMCMPNSWKWKTEIYSSSFYSPCTPPQSLAKCEKCSDGFNISISHWELTDVKEIAFIVQLCTLICLG